MVHRLDTQDFLGHMRVMVVHMLDEFQLGRPRPHHQYLFDLCDACHHFLQIALAGFSFAASQGSPMVMQVRFFRVGFDLFQRAVVRIEMDDVGFVVIHPNDGMVKRHKFSC
jgi:hypothetical protein